MTPSFAALCSDFYVNSKLSVKMDLPSERETILQFFERVRKEAPLMRRFRRFRGELALESPEQEGRNQWVALRRTSVRAGSVNPESLEEAHRLHRMVTRIAPFYLSINPLDIDSLEVLYGFDLEAQGNHNAIVYETLFADSPLARILDPDAAYPGAQPIDLQPFLGVALSDRCDIQAFFEIKTRTTPRQVRTGDEFGEIYDHHAVEFEYPDGSRMISYCRHIKGCWNSVSEHGHGTKGRIDFGGRPTIYGPDGKVVWRFSGSGNNPYQTEHDNLFAAIRAGEAAGFNEGEYGATSTMTSILGRMCTYSGQRISWDDAINSDIDLARTDKLSGLAEYTSFDQMPPAPKIATPGVTRTV